MMPPRPMMPMEALYGMPGGHPYVPAMSMQGKSKIHLKNVFLFIF